MAFLISDLQNFQSNLKQELLSSFHGQKTDLLYLKTNLPNKFNSKKFSLDLFQAMTIGGSHLETCLASFQSNCLKLGEVKNYPIPELSSKEVFLDLIKKYLNPKIKLLALNLAYPLQPIDSKLPDGILTKATKEHSFNGLIDKPIGQTIETYFQTQGQHIKVVVANDAVALISGAREKFRNVDSLKILCGVLGTGLNFAWLENENLAVNLELGNFSKFKLSYTGSLIDKMSNNPKTQLLEKETSGKYLYQHFNLLNSKQTIQSTLELSDLIKKNQSIQANFGKTIFNRSARLLASTISGLYTAKLELGHLKKGDLVQVVMEGSLFWKGSGYLDLVKKYLALINFSEEQVQFKHIQHLGLTGISWILIEVLAKTA